jgi:hypothetical protein
MQFLYHLKEKTVTKNLTKVWHESGYRPKHLNDNDSFPYFQNRLNIFPTLSLKFSRQRDKRTILKKLTYGYKINTSDSDEQK